MTSVVAFLGSSTVAGKGQAFDLVGELANRPANVQCRFLNFGVGGDLAFNALQRLPRIIDARPDKLVIVLGGNDMLASVFEQIWWIFRSTKRPPQRPSQQWFEANLRTIIWELKAKTPAAIAVASLPQVGWRLHVDGIHLNSRGGMIAADLIQQFLLHSSKNAVR